MNCRFCNTQLTGRQTAYCSRPCLIKGQGAERRDSGRLRKDAMTSEQYVAKLANNARDRAKNRKRYYEQVKCLWCGKEFESKHTKTTCLSCAIRLNVSFSSCTDLVKWTRPRVYIPTQTTGTAQYTSGTCRVCREGFTSPHQDITCSSQCRNKWRKQTGRAIKDWISDKDREAIFARDNWMCQICYEPVDKSIVWRANLYQPMMPSLDHIIPRSHGGDHEPGNLRLAHHLCNSRRGNSVDR